jgi:Tfp pilus assembly protein PilF
MALPRVWRLLLVLGSITVVLVLAGSAGFWWHRTTGPEHRLRRGQEALRSGATTRAEHIAARLEADGYKEPARLLKGEILYRQQKYGEAITLFSRMEDRGELLTAAMAIAGQCYLAQKKPHSAAEAFLQVLRSQPDDVEAHRGLALIYEEQGAGLKALEELLAVARSDPQDIQVQWRIARLYKDLPSANEPAIAVYQDLLIRELSASDAEAIRQELAVCLVRRGDHAQALQMLERGTAESATKPAILTLRARCLWKLGQVSQARALLDQGLRAHPREADLLRLRAQLHWEAKETQAASALLEQVLQLDRHDYASRELLAQAYEVLRRPAEAKEQRSLAERSEDDCKVLGKLLEEAASRPWDPGLHLRLAALYDKLGQSELAKHWRRIADASPESFPR